MLIVQRTPRAQSTEGTVCHEAHFWVRRTVTLAQRLRELRDSSSKLGLPKAHKHEDDSRQDKGDRTRVSGIPFERRCGPKPKIFMH